MSYGNLSSLRGILPLYHRGQRPAPLRGCGMREFLLLWTALFSLCAFFLMGFDKSRARKGKRRVRERTLLLTAAFGGAAGAVLGMYFFRHKTRHWYFKYGLPAMLLAHLGLAAALTLSPPPGW